MASIFTISPINGLFVPEYNRMGSLIEYLCLSSTKAVNVRIGTFLAFGMSETKAEGVEAGKGARVIEGLVAHRALNQLFD